MTEQAMAGVTFVVLIVAVAVGLALGARWLMRHPEKRGSGSHAGAILSAGADQLFHPHAATARGELDEQSRIVVEAATPDFPSSTDDGRIRLDGTR